MKGKTVTLDLDGWSNIHNEPVICASIVTEEAKSYLVYTIDTTGNKHDTQYLASIAKKVIIKTQAKFSVRVRSFVTDNAANMKAMRAELAKSEDPMFSSLIAYGCSTHLANLLAHDLDNNSARNNVIHIIKHIRNNHFAAGKFKQAGGNKLILPSEVRWNSVADSLESYLNQWSIIADMKNLDEDVEAKVLNTGIKRAAEDLYERLKIVSTAIDQLQGNDCNLSKAVKIWKKLNIDLNMILPAELKKKFDARYKQALTEWHLVAYSLDPSRTVSVTFFLLMHTKFFQRFIQLAFPFQCSVQWNSVQCFRSEIFFNLG